MLKKLKFLTVLPVLLGGVCDDFKKVIEKIDLFNKYLKQVTDYCVGLDKKTYEKNFINAKVYARYYKYVAIGIPPLEIIERLALDFDIGEPILRAILENHKYSNQAYVRFAKKYTIHALKKPKFKNAEIAKILHISENSVSFKIFTIL